MKDSINNLRFILNNCKNNKTVSFIGRSHPITNLRYIVSLSVNRDNWDVKSIQMGSSSGVKDATD